MNRLYALAINASSAIAQIGGLTLRLVKTRAVLSTSADHTGILTVASNVNNLPSIDRVTREKLLTERNLRRLNLDSITTSSFFATSDFSAG